MRRSRPRRRGFIDFQHITLGDYIILLAALLTTVSLFLPWVSLSVPRSHTEWAFTYSEVAAVIVIVFFLATIFLVVYPAVADGMNLPPLPFSTPPIFLIMAGLLWLIFTYELGKYACAIQCVGASTDFGVYVAWVASVIFLIGAVIKWGSRPRRRS